MPTLVSAVARKWEFISPRMVGTSEASDAAEARSGSEVTNLACTALNLRTVDLLISELILDALSELILDSI